jgi:hypothetical protein
MKRVFGSAMRETSKFNNHVIRAGCEDTLRRGARQRVEVPNVEVTGEDRYEERDRRSKAQLVPSGTPATGLR